MPSEGAPDPMDIALKKVKHAKSVVDRRLRGEQDPKLKWCDEGTAAKDGTRRTETQTDSISAAATTLSENSECRHGIRGDNNYGLRQH